MVTADRPLPAVLATLREAADRCAALLDATDDPAAHAIGDWSAADVGAHLVTVAKLAEAALPGGDGTHPFPDLAERIATVSLPGLRRLNEQLLRRYPERRPRQLAQDLRTTVAAIAGRCAGLPPEKAVPWFGGLRFPLTTALAHLLNELLIHGHDIARATGRRSPIPEDAAAVAFELFILTVFSYQAPGGEHGSGHAAVEFRSPHTRPVVLVTDHGRCHLRPAGEPVDARVRFSPAALLLLLFGRTGRLRAAVTGRVVVWGKRPWRLRPLLGSVYVP